jgi:hypothetical protein
MNKGEIIEMTNTQFSHQHGCLVEGHYYDCADGCECICGLPMNGNDHSDCPVELRPCPEHKVEHKRRMAEAMSCEQTEIETQGSTRPHCECGCADIDASTVGWCLHCDHVYASYTPELERWHFAYHCPGAPCELKQYAVTKLGHLP